MVMYLYQGSEETRPQLFRGEFFFTGAAGAGVGAGAACFVFSVSVSQLRVNAISGVQPRCLFPYVQTISVIKDFVARRIL